jgi:hypothetical protein
MAQRTNLQLRAAIMNLMQLRPERQNPVCLGNKDKEPTFVIVAVQQRYMYMYL